MRRVVCACVLGAIALVLVAAPASSAKRIELWKLRKGKAEKKVEQGLSSPPTEASVAEEAEAAPPERDGDSAEGRLAAMLRLAAAKSGLMSAGDIVALAGADLEQSPPTEVAEGEASPAEAVSPAPPLPEGISGEPVSDYNVVALAAGTFTHPKGQTITAAVFEMANSADAWGLFSRNRGEERLTGLGQEASYGPNLRAWKGSYAVVLSPSPPDPTVDRMRLSKLARDIMAMITSAGQRPTMIEWLPNAFQLPHTAIYFHANGPIGSDTLALSPQTDGVAAEYQIGETRYGGIIVRYPDAEAAIRGWSAFVTARIGPERAGGPPGGRRVGPEAGRWNGARAKGRVCAFVVGAATRNQAEVFLAQALSKASD